MGPHRRSPWPVGTMPKMTLFLLQIVALKRQSGPSVDGSPQTVARMHFFRIMPASQANPTHSCFAASGLRLLRRPIPPLSMLLGCTSSGLRLLRRPIRHPTFTSSTLMPPRSLNTYLGWKLSVLPDCACFAGQPLLCSCC